MVILKLLPYEAVAQRIGILDRKLRVVGENADNETDWLHWAMRAFEACYGYELQGDSLLTARINLLMTFADYYSARWDKQPAPKLYGKFLKRIVWNIWQMDGLTGALPCAEESDPRLTLADFAGANEGETAPPIPPPRCRIYDWRRKRSLEYLAMQQKRAKTMRFDYILGNPPYQEEVEDSDNKTFKPPIYNLFMDATYEIGDKVELIHPARFLFNAGQTPNAWNEKMLADPHLKVLHYEPDGHAVFASKEIKGGIAVTYHDKNADFGAIRVFTKYPELNTIMHKVNGVSLSTIMYNQNRFNLDKLYLSYPEYKKVIGSNGKDRRFRNNIFEKIDIFTVDRVNSDDIAILGVVKNKRVWRYFPKQFLDLSHENLQKWKTLVGAASGAGVFGEAISQPIILKPNEGYTQTYIGIGAFDSHTEAENLCKYIKTKFLRTLLGVLKITQHNDISTWRMVPLQDFTPASDIDWSQPIPAIDRQLYAKYGLDEQEIAFIESHVKEME